jgi:acyl-CoA hydrolase
MSSSQHNYISVEEALQLVQSNQRVFLHGSAATPIHLINKLIEQKQRLKNVELISITQQGIDLNSPDLEGHFFINSLFVSASNRKLLLMGKAEIMFLFF